MQQKKHLLGRGTRETQQATLGAAFFILQNPERSVGALDHTADARIQG